MKKSEPIRILYMEDDPGLARLVQKHLERAGYVVDLAYDGQQGLAMFESASYDVVAVDQSMPVQEGLQVVRALAERGPLPPTIMVTGRGSERIAVEAMKLGVSDYIVKDVEGGFLKLLPSIIDRALHRQHLAQERERALEALRRSETRYRSLFDRVPVGLYRSQPDGKMLDVNPALIDMLGYPDRETILSANAVEIYVNPEDRQRWQAIIAREGVVRDFEAQLRRYDGAVIWVHHTTRAIKDQTGGLLYYEGSVTDITERKQTELALVAQKQLYQNLTTVARVTAERPTLEDTLRNTLDVSVSLTQADVGSLFLLNQAGQVRRSILARGVVEPEEEGEIVQRVMEEGLAGWVAQQRQPALIRDTDEDERWLWLLYEPYQAGSALVVPILSGEALLGLLTLMHADKGYFERQHLQLMQAAADQMALALRNAQMYEEQLRQADRQATLYEVLSSVGGHLDPADVAREAVAAIARLTQWPGVAILLADETGEHLSVQAIAGSASVTQGWQISADRGITGRAFRAGQSQYVPDVSADTDYVTVHDAGIRSELAVPLRRGGHVLGVLNLESDRLDAFSHQDVLMAESLADAIGLALDNARLYMAAQQEITERKRAETQLNLQAAALEAAANGIVITDRQGHILWANPAFTQLTGYTVQEAVGENPRLLKSGQHEESFYRQMWETIMAGEVWRGEIVNRRKDGSLYTEEMTVTPVHDVQGDITHFIAIKQDITLRKWAEQELLRAKEAAEAANRAKSTFLANMSHELRTPLNAVIGYADMLEEEFQDLGHTDLLPDLHKIRDAGNHLLDMISDILDLSKIEAGRMELDLERFDLSTLVQEVVAAVQPRVAKNANILTVDLPDDLGRMHADPSKVRQIVLNLLSNAAKFTAEGSISLSVTRYQEPNTDLDWVRFQVSDTGIGMSPAQVDMLFQPFTQADASITRKYGGTGLGLAISQLFCQMMGGAIDVDSRLDQGSTFTVRLPMQVPKEGE